MKLCTVMLTLGIFAGLSSVNSYAMQGLKRADKVRLERAQGSLDKLMKEDITTKTKVQYARWKKRIETSLGTIQKFAPESASQYINTIKAKQKKWLAKPPAPAPAPALPLGQAPPLPSTPLDKLEMNIATLKTVIIKYHADFVDGKIPLDQFTVKPFIEQVQKLEEDLPKVTTQERSRIEKKLKQLKMGIGKLQITYVNKILANVYNQLDIIAKDITKAVTKEYAIAIYNKINQNFTILALLADLKGLKGDIEFSDYFDLAMKRKDNRYVVKFKTTIQTLRKRMVNVWETIMNVIEDDTKDKRIRKNLAQAGNKLGINIKLVEATFTPYLDDPKAKFKGIKLFHPLDNMDDYIYLMKAEEDKL